jgi:hypothetical protein
VSRTRTSEAVVSKGDDGLVAGEEQGYSDEQGKALLGAAPSHGLGFEVQSGANAHADLRVDTGRDKLQPLPMNHTEAKVAHTGRSAPRQGEAPKAKGPVQKSQLKQVGYEEGAAMLRPQVQAKGGAVAKPASGGAKHGHEHDHEHDHTHEHEGEETAGGGRVAHTSGEEADAAIVRYLGAYIPRGTVGITGHMLICNDAHYIEPARVLAARGAQLLVVPVHGGHRAEKEGAWRARGTNVLVARAVENGIPLVAADVAGWQGERVCHGTTTIIDSQGTIVATARQLDEDFIVADVSLDGVRGGIDGRLLGSAKHSVTEQVLALWS